MNQAYTLAQLVSKRLSVQKNTFLWFVDLIKAYDRMWRVGLRERLKGDVVQAKLISLVGSWYWKVKARVIINDVNSSWFESEIRLREGNTLSPLLFNVFIIGIVEKVAEREAGIGMGDKLLQILLFAHDIFLMAETEEGLNSLAGKLLNIVYL